MKNREPIDRTDEEQEGCERSSGFTAAARVVGRAVGFFKRLSPGSAEAAAKKDDEKKDGKRTKVLCLPAGRNAVQRPCRGEHEGRLRPTRRQLEQDLQRLEAELDRTYAAIVAGADSAQREGAPARAGELEQLIQRARELVDELQQKRQATRKLERDAARERKLGPQLKAAPVPEAPEQQARHRRVPAGRAGRRRVRVAVSRAESSGVPAPALELALGRVKAEGSQRLIIEQVARGLLDGDSETRRAAALRLGELDPKAAGPVLVAAVDDPDERVRSAALNALARQGDRADAQIFKRFLDDERYHLRAAALRGLAKTNDPSANARLAEALEDEHALARKTAATLLGWREAKDAVTPLILALRDHDPGVRQAAAGSLGALKLERAVMPLIRVLLDEAQPVRDAALASLHTLVGDDVDIAADPRRYSEQEVVILKDWWRRARVERRLDRDGGVVAEEAGAPAAPAGPRAAAMDSTLVADEAVAGARPRDQGAPADLTTATPVRPTGIGAARAPQKEPQQRSDASTRSPEAERAELVARADQAGAGARPEQPSQPWAERMPEPAELQRELDRPDERPPGRPQLPPLASPAPSAATGGDPAEPAAATGASRAEEGAPGPSSGEADFLSDIVPDLGLDLAAGSETGAAAGETGESDAPAATFDNVLEDGLFESPLGEEGVEAGEPAAEASSIVDGLTGEPNEENEAAELGYEAVYAEVEPAEKAG